MEATAVTNSGLSTVATSSIAPTLRKLGVSGCKVISDQGQIPIPRSTYTIVATNQQHDRGFVVCLFEALPPHDVLTVTLEWVQV